MFCKVAITADNWFKQLTAIQNYILMNRAGTTGGWGCNTPPPPPPPTRIVKKGVNLPRGGSGMVELRNVLNIKEFSGKLRSKKV
jgi:hypothetical protein